MLANLRSYLQTSGVLDLPRLGASGADLVDISLGRASFRPQDMPRIHVVAQSESSEEDTSDLAHQLRTALLIITVYISSYNTGWISYRSYYDSKHPITRSYSDYDDETKDDLRTDLEEIAQEISYRLRRDDLTQLPGIISFYDQSVEYAMTKESSYTIGIVSIQSEVKYRA